MRHSNKKGLFMKKMTILLFILGILLIGCSKGTFIVGVYTYAPNPDTVMYVDDASGIELYQIDIPNVGEGYYRHILNTSIDADGSNYNYSDDTEFTWSADFFSGRQQIAAFTDNEGNEKEIYLDPDHENALVDENGIIYPYIKN